MALRAGYYGVKKKLIESIAKFTDALVIKTIGTGLNLSNEGELTCTVDPSTGLIDYSTTEQDTGIKWIDGKAVYQKSFNLESSVNGTKLLEGVETVVAVYGDCSISGQAAAQGYQIPFYNSGSYNLNLNRRDAAASSYQVGDLIVEAAGVSSAHITVLYTKTTPSSKKSTKKVKED